MIDAQRSTLKHEIAVVGGGPVGAAAALMLARADFDVALIERNAAPPVFDADNYSSRVYALSPAARRLLQRADVWRNIAQTRICPYDKMQVWVDKPKLGLDFRAAETGHVELGWIVEHALLVSALWDALPAAGVNIVTGIGDVRWQPAQDENARLVLGDGRSLSARLVVAADGSHSALRNAAGIGTTGHSYKQRAIVCNLDIGQSHENTAWQRFLSTGPVAFLPLADGRCSLVWSANEARAAELLEMEDSLFCAELAEAIQVFAHLSTPTPRLNFPVRLSHAETYAKPGLVLVGDAAHSVHPLAGQGVNLGLGDVETLCKTLDEARQAGRDWAALRNLEHYARKRRAEAVEMLAVTDALQRAFAFRAPGLRQLLGRGMQLVDATAPLKTWLARQAAG